MRKYKTILYREPFISLKNEVKIQITKAYEIRSEPKIGVDLRALELYEKQKVRIVNF